MAIPNKLNEHCCVTILFSSNNQSNVFAHALDAVRYGVTVRSIKVNPKVANEYAVQLSGELSEVLIVAADVFSVSLKAVLNDITRDDNG